MIYGEDHHHTRLYFSYDSPHHGASYPFADLIGCKDMEDTGNILAMIAMGELRTDGARELFIYDRDESYNTYLGQSGGWKSYKVDPTVHPKRTDLVNTMLNDFNHIYSNVNDQRRGFPAFTRNVSLSLGSYLNNYSMDLDFQLYPGDMLFRQNAYFPLIVYNHYKYKETYASKNEVGHINFRRND